ncbi:hypothetical protein [Streptomyces sp. NPDC018036]
MTVTESGSQTLERWAELEDRASAQLLSPLSAEEGLQLMELLTWLHKA